MPPPLVPAPPSVDQKVLKETDEISSTDGQDSSSPDFEVYVTGFGPFRTITNNPSYLISSTLPSVLPASYLSQPASHYSAPKIKITRHPDPVKVSYTTVQSLIPILHASNPKTSLFLHIGCGNTKYTLESLARRGPYRNPDVDGELPPEGEDADIAAGGRVPVDVREFSSGIDLEGVKRSLQEVYNELGEGGKGEFVVPDISTDAGLYLCEYIYYTSTAEAIYMDGDNNKYRDGGNEVLPSTSKVLFVHVPKEADEESIERGKETVKRIIGAIVSLSLKREE